MQLLEILQRSTDYLVARGVESPRLQAELILAHILRMPRLQLYLEFNRDLRDPELGAAREAVRRRGQREPLQYVLGTTSFCGLETEVTPAVLIPRPETELLAERAWTWLAQHPAASEGVRVLDWGTGSGCLAIAVASHVPSAMVTALDQSSEALAVARRNTERHGLQDRIRFIQGSNLGVAPLGERFHLIVSNPPYIPTAEVETLQPEVRDHEPRLALDGGPDGLQVIRWLADAMAKQLEPGGCFMMEFGDGQADAVRDILVKAGWKVLECHRDHNDRERFVVAQSEA